MATVKKKAESWLTASLHKEFKSKTRKAKTTMARVMRAAAKDFVKRHTKRKTKGKSTVMT